jgi:hypothetical protein
VEGVLKDNTKKCPWVTDAEEMIKKTCVKQAAKYWPRRERLDNAVHHLNTEGGEGITLTPNKMPDAEFEAWKDAISTTDTKEAAKAKWRRRRDLQGPRRRRHRREAEGDHAAPPFSTAATRTRGRREEGRMNLQGTEAGSSTAAATSRPPSSRPCSPRAKARPGRRTCAASSPSA